MKNLYMTVGLMLVAAGGFAQNRVISGTATHPVSPDLLTPSSIQLRGGGGCPITSPLNEDFEGGVLPAGWTMSADVEQLDAMGNPLGTFVPPFLVGDSLATQTGGFFFVPAGMTTFAYANDDGPPCDCDMALVWISTPSIDLTGLNGVGMNFQALNDGLYCTTEATVDVSTDQGATWTSVYTIPEAGAPNMPVLQNITVPLAAYAGMPDVRIRWTWTDGGCWGTGLAIDNVCVQELASSNLTLTKAHIAEATAFYEDYTAVNQEYNQIPLEQTYPMILQADITNNGGGAQPNVVLSAEIFEGGASQGTFTSVPYPSLAAGAHDTLSIVTNWTPTQTGEVTINYSVASDSVDVDPSDNTGMKSFTVTGPSAAEGYSNMGQDANSMNGTYSIGMNSLYSGMGQRSEIQNPNSLAYGIGAAFGTATPVGSTVIVTLLSDDAMGIETVAVSDLFQIEPWHRGGTGSNNIVFIPFDPISSDPSPVPVPLDPLKDYISIIENPGADSVRLGTSGTLNPGGLFSVDPALGDLTQYIGEDNPAVMVRLFLADAPVGILDLTSNGLTLGPNMPNPFTGYTTIPYTLKEGAEVNFEVIDMAGKVAFVKNMGRMPAGSHLMDLDGTPLAPGAYQYVLTAGQDRLARRMIVTR